MTFVKIISGACMVLGLGMFFAGIGVGVAANLELIPRVDGTSDAVAMLIKSGVITSLFSFTAFGISHF